MKILIQKIKPVDTSSMEGAFVRKVWRNARGNEEAEFASKTKAWVRERAECDRMGRIR